ncbi:ATP-binding protein [Alloiococcus sp. CFN-8]|uniref:ATP-binding protein n=1 Tax=Alloiococcus sp. CFN-8 TaxID=3416081 RepID=UPI003CE84E75
MNFKETLKTLELVIKTREVPLIIGESGIGKTSLIKKLCRKEGYYLITIDANLLKEGEIGGLPTVEEAEIHGPQGSRKIKRTVYAAHTKLMEIQEVLDNKKADKILLFIDELNRCDHAVQQELMNLILNREINGFKMPEEVRVAAAMNPSGRYEGFENSEYQVVDMDPAQEDRFVWLYMDSEAKEWISWGMSSEGNIHPHVVEFIAAFPQHLHTPDIKATIKATPRSWERVSKVYGLYKNNKDEFSSSILYNAIKGNVGADIAQDFMAFIENYKNPMISPERVLELMLIPEELKGSLSRENPSRLYIFGRNFLRKVEERGGRPKEVEIFSKVLSHYPKDLRIGLMKEIKENYSGSLYEQFLEDDTFLEVFFESYQHAF